MEQMRRRLAAVACVVIVVAAVARFGHGQPAATQPTTQPGGAGDARPARPRGMNRGGGQQMPANIEAAMKGVNRAMRQLKTQITDPSKRDENLRLALDNPSQVGRRLCLVEQTKRERQRAFKLYIVDARGGLGAVSGSIPAQSLPGTEMVNEKAWRKLLLRQALQVGATGFEPATS